MSSAPAPVGPYSEIAPPADLAPYVDRLWLRTGALGASGRVHRVLPDGCVDVIVHADRGAAELVGTMTRAIEVPDGPSDLIAVRFRPGTATAVTSCGLAELTDRSIDLAELDIADGLAERIADAARAVAGTEPGFRLPAKIRCRRLRTPA